MDTAFELHQSNTILYCARWAETVAFYGDLLGLPVSFANDWFVEFHLGGSSYLSIANAARATIAAVGGQGVTLAWQVADVAATRARLIKLGVAATPLQEKWGGRLTYCHDPEGHRLEFWQAGDPGG